ncbi:MAG TPA: helix-turn-helix domain-containing protein [Kofleriaceae bacterium]|nr:helix-turn-helix domain-containing protein [Kofleriaceae bacterium]
MARALDLLGERWTLLVIRELLCGSTRFNDLRRGIPRISRTMLAARLRDDADRRAHRDRRRAPAAPRSLPAAAPRRGGAVHAQPGVPRGAPRRRLAADADRVVAR